MPVLLLLYRLRQEDYRFEANLSFIGSPCLGQKQQQKTDVVAHAYNPRTREVKTDRSRSSTIILGYIWSSSLGYLRTASKKLPNPPKKMNLWIEAFVSSSNPHFIIFWIHDLESLYSILWAYILWFCFYL